MSGRHGAHGSRGGLQECLSEHVQELRAAVAKEEELKLNLDLRFQLEKSGLERAVSAIKEADKEADEFKARRLELESATLQACSVALPEAELMKNAAAEELKAALKSLEIQKARLEDFEKASSARNEALKQELNALLEAEAGAKELTAELAATAATAAAVAAGGDGSQPLQDCSG